MPEFFRTVCRSFRELGRLHLLSLEANGERVAMACNVRAGEGIFCLKIAFDERWRRYSPGAQLMLEHAVVVPSRGRRGLDGLVR